MDDGMRPRDDWSAPDASDEPTQPLPVIRPGGARMPQPNGRRAEMPPLPPAAPRWPPGGPGADDPTPYQEWPGERSQRFSGIERALQAARDRQLSLGCGAITAIVLLVALVLAALGGNFAALGGSPFVPHPNIQAAPRATATNLPTPTASPRPTPTPSPLPTATPSPIPTATPAPSSSPSPSPTPISSPTPVPSPTPAPSPSPPPQSSPIATPGTTPASSPGEASPASSPATSAAHFTGDA
ncbi:MAG TPA: hypothetical protein VF116_23195 [Ktedonobacterales bacterium]